MSDGAEVLGRIAGRLARAHVAASARAVLRPYHIKQLLDAGIVEREKRGSYAYFSLAPGALERVCGLLGYSVGVTAAA